MARAKQAEIDERREQIERLLLERVSVRGIAELTTVPRSTVGRDIVAIRDEWRRERIAAIDRATDEELQRINALEKAYWRLASEPDAKTLDVNFQALTAVIKLMERRSRLLGLDAPKRIDIEARVRAWARENELDEDEVVREAMRVVRERA
jgi:IS30 family transposase